MRIPQRSRDSGLKFNITPMIDVVFNLIIFFLAASHIARSTSQKQVNLPEATKGQQEREERQKRLVITVTRDESLWLSGNRVTLADVDRMLADAAPEPDSKQAGREVRIRTDREVPYRAIEPLLVTCAKAGVTNIKFAVIQAKGK
ncbi:MAG: biopolymer transporter ExbD [Planctomycetales bacterium]|nr:biopolymer transporter ExbD [Planctomycetales bacterium]